MSDPYHLPYWIDSPPPTLYYLLETFPSYESIIDILSLDESIWENHHHRSSFLSHANLVDSDFFSLINSNIVKNHQTHVLLQDTNSEGNLCNIAQMTPIDISVNPRMVEHVHVGQNFSMEDIEKYRDLFK